MHNKTFFAIVLTSLFVTSSGIAYWEPINTTRFKSRTGKYLFKISPDRYEERVDNPGKCKATLFKVDGSEKEALWTQYLVNDYAPAQVFVTSSGKYIVTIDEWPEDFRSVLGTFPVVIYGPNGKLIKVHNDISLGLGDDFDRIETLSGSMWNEDSIIFFGPVEEYLFIRLHWGRLLVIDLSTGDLCGKAPAGKIDDEDRNEMGREKWEQLQNYARQQIEELALSKLDSFDLDERKAGALVVAQLKIRRAIPRLRELLDDKAYGFTSTGWQPWHKVYPVRKAARQALISMGEHVPFLKGWMWAAIGSVIALFLILCGLRLKRKIVRQKS